MHCSRTIWSAFWVMACLAREAGAGAASMTASAIASRQRLPPAYVSKILAQLSRAGFVRGARGPHGGYRLTRPPEGISLADIAAVFESGRPRLRCPLGNQTADGATGCPLHAPLHSVTKRWDRFLRETSLTVPATHPTTVR